MDSSSQESPLFSFGTIADVQYADADDGHNFKKTSCRHYRNALTMLDKAVSTWNVDSICKPQFVLQLGDSIDGVNKKLGISESSLAAFLSSISKFEGPIYHVFGNHEFYNFSRTKLIQSDLYSGNSQYCTPVNGKMYYSCIPHPNLRILALDCYEISLLASPKHSEEHHMANKLMRVNENVEKNSSDGLDGEMVRFVKYNGALSPEQLRWIQNNLEETRTLQQNVIVIGHCGVYGGATHLKCLCWNAPEVLALLQSYSDCVVAYLSGHDHSGGDAYDTAGIFHMAFQGVVENGDDADFGTFYGYSDRLQLKGHGRVPDREISLRFPLACSKKHSHR